MRSTRMAAHRAAKRSIAGAVLALALTLTLTTPAQAKKPSCWMQHGQSAIARCFIARAADHYHQPRSQAYYIAWRESRFNWRVTNRSSGAAGMFQFMPGTWAHSPYRHRSPYNPRWAALAAMWYWAHGGKFHWNA
jgi:hypothetical protein